MQHLIDHDVKGGLGVATAILVFLCTFLFCRSASHDVTNPFGDAKLTEGLPWIKNIREVRGSESIQNMQCLNIIDSSNVIKIFRARPIAVAASGSGHHPLSSPVGATTIGGKRLRPKNRMVRRP